MILSIVASWYSWDHLCLRGKFDLIFPLCEMPRDSSVHLSQEPETPFLHPSFLGAPLFPAENGGMLDAEGKPLPLSPARLEGYEQAGMPARGTAARSGSRRARGA